MKSKYLKVLYIVFFFCLVSCNDQFADTYEIKEIPDNVLSKERMIRLLVEMHLIEATIVQLQLKGEDINVNAIKYYNDLFQKEQIDYNTIKRSLNYYADHKKDLDEIYVKVIEKLNQMQSEVGQK